MNTYRCWNPDTGDADDGKDVRASDSEHAAITFARWYDSASADYGYATNGGTVAVALDGVEIERWAVTGEQDIVYSARAAQGGSNG